MSRKALSFLILPLFLLSVFPLQSLHAQVYAQLKLRDSKLRYPKINEIEFKGSADPRATYDAIYGHGAMWESEYVGFRIYMDHRQSIDLYGKKYPQLELDSTNFYSDATWMAKGYGEDILYAGQSIAAGSFRGFEDNKLTYIDKVSARGQRIVKEGPDTVMVEVWDKDWNTNGKTLQMRQVYTMLRGHRDVQIDIYLEGVNDQDVFATGVQKLEMDNEGFILPLTEPKEPKDNRKTHKKANKPESPQWQVGTDGALVGSWGRNIPEKGHPELVEGVGIGVYVPSEFVHEVKEDELNYLCFIHPVNGHIRYHLAVCAEMQVNDGFKKSQDWFGWLRQWSATFK
ncbi:MAG: DUF4861 domain-containing protein [Bacteroidaceae bacterium]|nr:DUF4861 domain-containing protein [Bacteroidaceae bacterium]